MFSGRCWEPLLPVAARRGRPRRWPSAGVGQRGARPYPNRVSPAGRPHPVRALVAGVRAVRVLAGAGGLGAGRGRATCGGRRQREAVPAGVGSHGLHHCPRPHPRCWRAPGQRESCCWGAGSPRLGKIARGAGAPRHTPRSTSIVGSWRSSSLPARTATARNWSPCSRAIVSPAQDPGDLVDARSGCWPIRPTPPERTGPGYASTTSPRPSLSPPTKPATGPGAALTVAGPLRSTSSGTRTVTPSSAASTTSNTTEGSPPATTSSAVRYAASVHIASIDHWLKRLS